MAILHQGMQTGSGSKNSELQTMKGDNSMANQEPQTNAQADEQVTEVPQKSRLHVYTNKETIKRFTIGYLTDKTFKTLVN